MIITQHFKQLYLKTIIDNLNTSQNYNNNNKKVLKNLVMFLFFLSMSQKQVFWQTFEDKLISMMIIIRPHWMIPVVLEQFHVSYEVLDQLSLLEGECNTITEEKLN